MDDYEPHRHYPTPEGMALVSFELLEELRDWWEDRDEPDESGVVLVDPTDVVERITAPLNSIPSEGIDENGNYTVSFSDGLTSKISLDGDRGAVFSEDGSYRYLLHRQWDPSLPVLGWLMLNPSVANAEADDPTVMKCIGFAERNGFGGIVIANIFAAVSTDPKELSEMADPVGPENVYALGTFVHSIHELWFAWGNGIDKVHEADEAEARILISRVYETARFHDLPVRCLGMTKFGNPRHPGRIAYATEPVVAVGGNLPPSISEN